MSYRFIKGLIFNFFVTFFLFFLLMSWAWWDLPGWLTVILQCCDTVGWVMWSIKSCDRAFPVAAARAWNSLPPAVRDAPSLLTFRSRLKTWLFELTLAWHWPHSPAALYFVFYFNNSVKSVKCPCNVIHDSVTLIFTFLIIIIIISIVTCNVSSGTLNPTV